jgi:hypothetical protein
MDGVHVQERCTEKRCYCASPVRCHASGRGWSRQGVKKMLVWFKNGGEYGTARLKIVGDIWFTFFYSVFHF